MMSMVIAQALGPVEQEHLLQARHMQALSFAVHIPLVCFGIAFPVMVLAMEGLGRRTGDPLYTTIARRWSRIMIALFAVGVITGTVLSFEMGVLWPNFTATFGGVFGLGFAIEGFSFFLEAIFIGIYVYGWDRLPPRLHLLSGIPIVLTGFLGSWMVISVNAWMNHPGGFRLDAAGRVVDVHPWRALFANSYLWHEVIHMYVAAYLVTGFVVAGAYAAARLRGRWTRTLLATLGLLVLYLGVRRRRLPSSRMFWVALVAAGPLACVALVAGWVTTEVGRQPWVVFGVMRTEAAVTGAGVVPVGYGVLCVVYLAVAAGTFWILRRLARVPVEVTTA
jgi:cytochrome d ubiquinol oxidase subunit I